TPDISSTLLSLADIEVPDSFEGFDFSEILEAGKNQADRAALYMSVSSFAFVQPEFKREYRAIKTGQYTYVKGIDGPWMLFDDLKDPFQMNNLIDNPEYTDIQEKLEDRLKAELHEIKDDFRPAASYISEWGYKVKERGQIGYKKHNQETVQSPIRNK
ncbi:MAG: DUF4976 domain-containing protein, partial [Deltaproteobacteria bacterium]|nr:DUF4976 domain-containing protein [Deltaproteobacteria bacterium]